MPSGFLPIRKAIAELRRLGATVENANATGHYIFRHPDIMRPVHQHGNDNRCNAKTMSMIRRLQKAEKLRRQGSDGEGEGGEAR